MNDPLKDDDEVLAVAEAIANSLGSQTNSVEAGDVEARLRASTAAARYARDAYLAMMEHANESPVAFRFLSAAATARERKQLLLRHRVVELIAEISFHLNHRDLMNVADAVLSARG
jgi:hypothetical protein